MPLYQLTCTSESCAITFEDFIALSSYPYTPPCPKCGEPTIRDMRAARAAASSADPVVVYKAPDGTYRFPPDTQCESTAMYDAKGYQRIELRGWTDVRRFESTFNQKEMSEVRRRIERAAEQHERSESARRSEVRRCIEQGFQVPELDSRGRPTGRTQTVRLSERGKAFLHAAMDHNDRKGGPRARDVGFHVDAYANDRSNRDRDPRRRDQ